MAVLEGLPTNILKIGRWERSPASSTAREGSISGSRGNVARSEGYEDGGSRFELLFEFCHFRVVLRQAALGIVENVHFRLSAAAASEGHAAVGIAHLGRWIFDLVLFVSLLLLLAGLLSSLRVAFVNFVIAIVVEMSVRDLSVVIVVVDAVTL